jgi:hypothetical protein
MGILVVRKPEKIIREGREGARRKTEVSPDAFLPPMFPAQE